MTVFLLLAGCSRTNQEKRPASTIVPIAPAAQDQGGNSESRTPYYIGLIEEYKTLLAEDPGNLASNIALANAYFDSGQWREAIMYYERALQIDPRNPDIRTDMATSYRNLGMTGAALDQYRKALEYDPGHQNARYNIGVIYAHDRHDYAAAIHIWEDLLRIAPHHPRAEAIRINIEMFKKLSGKGGK